MPKVIHFEIPADDPERLVIFYTKVFGWKTGKYGPMNYWLVTAGEEEEPGINGAISEKSENNPTTTNTIAVASLEDTVAKIKRENGQVLTPKMVVPTVGYMCYCKDPEGNVFGIMQTDKNAK